MSNSWEAILFDWDDTLCGAEPHRYTFAQHAAADFGVNLTMAEVYDAFAFAGDSAAGAWGPFIERLPAALGIPVSCQTEFVERYRHRDLIKAFHLFDDVIATFDWLAGLGLRAGIISNNDEAVDRVRELNIESRVEIIVSPATFGVGKPDPRIFTESMALMRVNSTRAIYVGDSFDNDIVGSRAAGLTPVLIDRFGVNPRPAGYLRVTQLAELASFVPGTAGAPLR